MMYLYLDRNRVKLLYLRKTILSQYESAFYEKTHQVDLLNKSGEIANTDYLASAIKGAVTAISKNPMKEKGVCLILPHVAFQFLRTEVPDDIAPTAVGSFLTDKVRAAFPTDTENLISDYILVQNETEKHIIYYGLQKDVYAKFAEVFHLINLDITAILPDTLTYFKLFEKTLRKEKKEHILYINSESNYLGGYLYDSYGPLEEKKTLNEKLRSTSQIEKYIKEKADEYEKQGKKINRIVLSGEYSDEIRQDTFTKNVGVWTNPLKRIIPDFYQDYVKVIIPEENKTIPLLQFDVCLGAFIFSVENKQFSLIKQSGRGLTMPSIPALKIGAPAKLAGIFLISFGISFGLWTAVQTTTLLTSLPTLPKLSTTKPTEPIPTIAAATPLPTATPSPSVDRAEVRIKILNGSGIKGKASDVKAVLVELGYSEILTGNADSFDYETTEIQIATDASASAKLLIKDLKEYVDSPDTSDLTGDSSADIVLVVGTDFK